MCEFDGKGVWLEKVGKFMKENGRGGVLVLIGFGGVFEYNMFGCG